MVGRWQALTQVTTTVPQRGVVTSSKTPGTEKIPPEKVLMPPPSLPGGFGRSKGQIAVSTRLYVVMIT